jgi:hypothetical protein
MQKIGYELRTLVLSSFIGIRRRNIRIHVYENRMLPKGRSQAKERTQQMLSWAEFVCRAGG